MPLWAMPDNKQKWIVHKLARYGSVAIGVVYVLVGVIAILSLLRVRQGGADESGILNILRQVPFGKVLIALIFFGLVAYLVWKFYNAFTDPYGYGSHWKGLMKRAGIAAGGVVYGLMAYSAAQAFLGLTSGNTHGQPAAQQEMVASVFDWWAGEWLVGLLGILVALTGVAQFAYVIRKSYREKLSVSHMPSTQKKVVTVLAWSGHFARGSILLITAYFLVKAAVVSRPSQVVNTDKAFDFIGDHISVVVFALVAAGTVCYGLYKFALGWYYNFTDDF